MLKMNRAIALAALAVCAAVPAIAENGKHDGSQWPSYGGDLGSTKYSPLDQINAENVKNLKVAWTWDSPDNKLVSENRRLMPFANETTPIMIDGTLYLSTCLSQVAAVDAATGETKWVYDPKAWEKGRPTNLGFLHRGVAYWTDGKGDERIFIGTGDAFLIALDAKTGQPIPTFGENGKIDLTLGLRRPITRRAYAVSSPPIVCRDVVAVGSSISDGPTHQEAPPGDVRGFDARTGKVVWTFQSIAQPGEFGHETWEGDGWKKTGNANVWTLMSADEELGYMYLPFGTPTNDWYGGHRLGDGLFGETLVCVEAATGKRVWHFQTTHHGVWDYDLPAAPVLMDITVDGKPIKALAQITKQGFVFVLDRTNGKSVWPIEERAVPQSTVPGEKTSPTQPFPTKPPAYERQGMTEDDLIDYTPELKEEAKNLLAEYDHGPLYTPPTERGTIYMPGWAGGANWGGAAFDPETQMFYVPSITSGIRVALGKPDPNRSDFNYTRNGSMQIRGPQGLPLWKGPYGRVTAYDMTKGDIKWQIPLGDGPRNHEALKDLNLPPLGSPQRGYPLLTKTLLFVAQEGGGGRTSGGGAPRIWAIDKASGEIVHSIELEHGVSACPMTYVLNGKQHLVQAIGGGRDPQQMVAYTLP